MWASHWIDAPRLDCLLHTTQHVYQCPVTLNPGTTTVMLHLSSACRSAVCGESVLVVSRGRPSASTANSTRLPKGYPALLGWLDTVLRTPNLQAVDIDCVSMHNTLQYRMTTSKVVCLSGSIRSCQL